MGYLGGRIGKSQNTGTGARGENGDLGGGIMDLFTQGYFAIQGKAAKTEAAVTPLSVTGGNSSYTFGGKKIHVWTSPGPFVVTGGPAPLEYFVVAGGGAGGADMGGGGGGGGILTGDLDLTGPFSTTVTIGGGGGAHPRGTQTPTSAIGDPSVLNNPVSTITAFGGGFGDGDNDPAPLTYPESVGSGGGGFGQTGGDGKAAAPTFPGPAETQQGTPGYRNNQPRGGGGGGAGRDAPPVGFGGQQQDGGYGLAIPATFRDPSNPFGGPNGPPQSSITGNFYFAGGGVGGHPNNANAFGGGGTVNQEGSTNTGGGGGGGPGSGGSPGGDGGPGIIFVAYTP